MTPFRVGITGGIGSGKSTVCRLFSLWGVPVYDCDAQAKELMESDPQVIRALINLLGVKAYRDGRLDRELIASRVFADPQLLAALDGIVHPAVGRDFEAWAARQKGYVVMESAILFDSGFDARVDETVAVTAPDEVRIARVMGRSGCSREEVLSRMKRQMPQQKVLLRAGHRIENHGRLSLIGQVAALHNRFRDGR